MENQSRAAMNQKLYQFQMLKERRDWIEDQLEFLRVANTNYYNTRTTVDKLKDIDANDEILFPIGGIINLKGQLKEPGKILVYITDDVVIEKTIDETIEYLDNLIEKTNEQLQNLSSQFQNLEYALRGMSQELTQNFRGMNPP